MIKSDRWIKQMALETGMIEPFAEKQVQKGVISYGVSGYGYDMRLGTQFKRPKTVTLADPKNFNQVETEDISGDTVVIAPQSLVWGQTLEYFRIPPDVVTVTQGKSTYARLGLILNVTPFDPEWEGHATLALVNPMNYPIQVYAGEGIGQILFFQGDEVPDETYASKGGKYNKALEIQTSRIKE